MPSEVQRRTPGFFGGEPRTAATGESLANFFTPRYWRTWVFVGWLRFWSLLPWHWSLAVHGRMGQWIGSRSGKSRQIVQDNLLRCLPELSSAERTALMSEYFANMGALVAELALAWFRNPRRVRSLIDAEGVGHVEDALARGRGVILFLGHFTTMEMCGVGVGGLVPRFIITQNARRSRLLSEIQRRARNRLGDEVFDKHNVRGLLRNLRDNAVVWFAGDEATTGKSAALLPFFGTPALTNTSLSRLARISGAAVIPLFYRRKADQSGYLVRFGPALDDFPSSDVIADTERLTAILEDQIRECPAQYFWKQRRFRQRRGEL